MNALASTAHEQRLLRRLRAAVTVLAGCSVVACATTLHHLWRAQAQRTEVTASTCAASEGGGTTGTKEGVGDHVAP